MNAAKYNPSSFSPAEKRISGFGLFFIVAFMLLCAWGVMSGWNAENGSQLFGHAYAITADQVPHFLS